MVYVVAGAAGAMFGLAVPPPLVTSTAPVGEAGGTLTTGVGVLCTYLWTQKKDKSVMDGIDYLMAGTEKEYPVLYQGEKADLYAWYYNTQACLMVGGAAWTKWNSLFQGEIVKAQAPDGSWPPMKSVTNGAYQTAPLGPGLLYRTNLCILMLEVYYRYMPSTK